MVIDACKLLSACLLWEAHLTLLAFDMTGLRKCTRFIKLPIYNDPCILWPPIQPEKCGLSLKVVLKWRDIYPVYWKYRSSVTDDR